MVPPRPSVCSFGASPGYPTSLPYSGLSSPPPSEHVLGRPPPAGLSLLASARLRSTRTAAYRHLTTTRNRLLSTWGVLAHGAAFGDVQRYCGFVGYPRSGHSLVGSLLNAHPDAVIAHELDAVKLVEQGLTDRQVYALILSRDRWFQRQQRVWTGFDYSVPGQWQGRFRRLSLIGDKKGGATARHLRREPDLLDRFQATIRHPVTFVHVVRNPFDNIATMARRGGGDLAGAAKVYLELASTVQWLENQVSEERVTTVFLEELIDQPGLVLGNLCRALGLEPIDGYLEACNGIVRAKPHRSASEVEWTPSLLADLRARIQEIPTLARYEPGVH